MKKTQDDCKSDFQPYKLDNGTGIGSHIEKTERKKRQTIKASDFLDKHLSRKGIARVDTCHDYMRFLTDKDFDKKRLDKANSCGNRFCPICSWKKSKKDAIKISTITSALQDKIGVKFLFLTLTSPNISAEELADEIKALNLAFSKMFKRDRIKKAVLGYVRKLEVTTDQNPIITEELYKRKKKYFANRGLKVGDDNPQYNTYNPHFHCILVVKRGYFGKHYIKQDEWLNMWREAKNDTTITQVKVTAVKNLEDNAEEVTSNPILEIAKYTAKDSDLFTNQDVFDTLYLALKGRQLLVYSGEFKNYAKMYDNGELDEYKYKEEVKYVYFIRTTWNGTEYEAKLKRLTKEEFEEVNGDLEGYSLADETG